MSQSDALKISGGVDLLKQLRELGLQHINLHTNNSKAPQTIPNRSLCSEVKLGRFQTMVLGFALILKAALMKYE